MPDSQSDGFSYSKDRQYSNAFSPSHSVETFTCCGSNADRRFIQIKKVCKARSDSRDIRLKLRLKTFDRYGNVNYLCIAHVFERFIKKYTAVFYSFF